MSIDLERAIAIEKGCSIEDLSWLTEAVAGKLRIVELGSLHGRSTRAMLDNSEAHIWCIDSWQGAESGIGLITDDDDYAIFLENVRDVRWRVTILKMFTHEAVEMLPVRFFDMVFIDACHSYEAVKFDITHYAPLLREGGLLCGHDAGRKEVGRAVEELIDCPMKAAAAIWWAVAPFLKVAP